MKPRKLNISYSVKRDCDVWQDLKDGSRKALDYIYYCHISSLMAYGKQFTYDSALVDDCIQELFFDIWVKRERLGNTSSIRFYLLKSLKRRIFRALKKEEKRMSFNDFGDLYQDGPTLNPLEVSMASDLDVKNQNEVMELVERLSPVQKEIIFLKFFNNLTFDEIADVLELSKKQLYNTLSKAMNKLRKSLLSIISIVMLIG